MTDTLHSLTDLDRVIHEPSRLLLVALLSSVESADFLFLLKQSRLTKGNLTVHLSRLEEAGYIQIEKSFRGKVPHTEYRITPLGLSAFEQYRKSLGTIFDIRKDSEKNSN
jgi:DNA-binding PadR family transcriptional regulator